MKGFILVLLLLTCLFSQAQVLRTTTFSRQLLTQPDQNSFLRTLGLPELVNGVFPGGVNTNTFYPTNVNAVYYPSIGQYAILASSIGVAFYNTNGATVFYTSNGLLTVNGTTFTGTVNTSLTNQFTIAVSGWTNTNYFNCVAIMQAASTTVTYSDGINVIRTFTSANQEFQLPMKPGYKVTAASGLSGVAIAQ